MNDLLLKDKHGIARCEIANPAEDLLFQGDGYRIYLASTPNGKETVFLRLYYGREPEFSPGKSNRHP